MALEVVDKMRIGKYLKTTALDDLYWGGFFENVRKDKYSDYDVLVFLVDSFLNKISVNTVTSCPCFANSNATSLHLKSLG